MYDGARGVGFGALAFVLGVALVLGSVFMFKGSIHNMLSFLLTGKPVINGLHVAKLNQIKSKVKKKMLLSPKSISR